MKKIILALLFFTATTCFASTTPAKLISTSEQLIIVTTPTWDSAIGQLQRYTRSSTLHAWQPVGKSVAVVIGKNGTAWGDDHKAIIEKENDDLAPIKHEGDGKTPVGIYRIGQTFGFAETNNTNNYFPLTDTSICVDDINSTHYNQLIDSSKVSQVDWNSGEKMRTVPQYKMGAMVLYNMPPVKSAGSCIFLHIWKNSASGTAGCIAMEESNLAVVLDWLHEKQQPVIAVLPAQVYNNIKAKWKLPEIS